MNSRTECELMDIEVPLDFTTNNRDIDEAFNYPTYPTHFLLSGCVGPPPFYKRKVGRMYVLKEKIDKDGLPRFQCIIGPCWPMALLTLCLLVGIPTVVFILCMPGFPTWIVSIASIVIFITVISFLCTACTDPGIQRRYVDEVRDPSWVFDEQAQSYRAPGCIYDRESQVVIYKVDHFCPWTGTIIARKNLCWFYLFTVFVMLSIGVVVAVAVIRVSGAYS